MFSIQQIFLPIQVVTLPDWHYQLGYWAHYIEKYIFADWQFLNFLVVLVTIDTILGWYKACKSGTFSSKLLHILFQKVIIYLCFLILAHIVSHFTIEGEKNGFFAWFNSFAYSAIIVKESISVLENMGAIRPGLIPSWILKKLKQYDKDGFFTAQPENKAQKIKQKIMQ